MAEGTSRPVLTGVSCFALGIAATLLYGFGFANWHTQSQVYAYSNKHTKEEVRWVLVPVCAAVFKTKATEADWTELESKELSLGRGGTVHRVVQIPGHERRDVPIFDIMSYGLADDCAQALIEERQSVRAMQRLKQEQ